ncbi:hypothetical protein SAMN04489864_10554 [Pedobacter insulae]|uniref:Uncharacterized protein n=2 Tax=Pedobacter insulae TaxID=414048 RepID=A0A1I2X7S0_9SPHI|nr:hypothetical protein SAMN04489864_10554 [Pedobacter insulae]
MRNLKEMDCEALTRLACEKIVGGSTSTSSSIWLEIGYATGIVMNGLWGFSVQGGRNAGLTVK